MKTRRFCLPLLLLLGCTAALWPLRHQFTAESIAARSPKQAVLAAGLLLLALRDLAAGLMNLGSGYSVGKGYIHVIDIEIRRGEETVLINWEKQEMKGSEQIIYDCLQKLKISEG